MNRDELKKRIATRNDMTMSLVHLTKPTETEGLAEVLIKILKEKKLRGSTTKSGFIVGNRTAVCFQDTPLYSLAQNVYYEQNANREDKERKQRYYGAGLIFEKEFIYRKGGRPVIYDKTTEAKLYLPENQHWRIVNLDLSNRDSIIDWTHEREWRIPNDLEFELTDIKLLVPRHEFLKKFNDICIKEGINLYSEVKSIVCLSDLFF